MATPLAFRTSRVTIQGTMFGGAEEWSTGFWFGLANADAELPTQALADGVRNAWRTFISHQQSYISNAYTSTIVKVSSVGTDGKSDANDTIYSSFASTDKGVRAERLPPQCALVATLMAADNRGLASKGRMYLPGVVIGVTDNGQTDPFNTNLIAVNFKAFINSVNAIGTGIVVNASHGQLTRDPVDGSVGPKVGGRAPVNKAVTRIQIGTVYDTQRRRRNGLNEQYQMQSLV